MLFGKCAYLRNKDNPNIKKAVVVNGCPPAMDKLDEVLKETAGITCDYNEYVKYRHHIFQSL